ncbi:MAG TPA: PAS domain-containing protein [Synechococcales cyanobacterium M55_K2018_004]|nr:PAS domain-containing protein [Synechococcales cyanobacterium M55_K2018_004]
MLVIGVGVGFGCGLLLLVWQRSHLNKRIRRLLHELRAYVEESSLSSTSQLAMAVTRQQQLHRQLQQEIETFQRILDVAPIGYLQVDDENRLVWCNPHARQLLGMGVAPGASPRLLLELVRSYELDDLIEQARDEQKIQQKDWTFYPVSPDPSLLSKQPSQVLRAMAFPLHDGGIGIFIENRQEAITLMQQRDRWASDVAHELKTPLTSIRLVAETLHSRLEPPLQGWVDRLISETIRLSNLVQDLLELAHLDRDATQCLKRKTVNLPELIQSAWLSLEPLACKKNLHLSYQGPTELLVEVDEPRLYRVLINLLDNSIKYSPVEQTIWVALDMTTTEDSPLPQVVLDVIDAGPGFPEHALPHVFDRFFRADPARMRSAGTALSPSSRATGLANSRLKSSPEVRSDPPDLQRSSSSGLGLAIVRQIVEAHQGQVSAQNHPETGGAWVRLFLPLFR